MSETFTELQAEAEEQTRARDAVQERIADALERIAAVLETFERS